MKVGYPIISADSHITEPPNTYTDFIDPAWRDRAPHLVDGGDKMGDMFVVEGSTVPIPMGLVAAAAGGCRNDPSKPAGEPGTVDVTVGNKPFRLWIAATAQSREYGLMNRPSMPPDRGMLFVFRREEPKMSFWMRNTLIPLDIIYLDAGGQVVSISSSPAAFASCERCGPMPCAVIATRRKPCSSASLTDCCPTTPRSRSRSTTCGLWMMSPIGAIGACSLAAAEIRSTARRTPQQ